MALGALRWAGGDANAGHAPEPQPETVVRYEWEGRFGPMVVEIRGGQAFVNGRAVEPFEVRPQGQGSR